MMAFTNVLSELWVLDHSLMTGRIGEEGGGQTMLFLWAVAVIKSRSGLSLGELDLSGYASQQ